VDVEELLVLCGETSVAKDDPVTVDLDLVVDRVFGAAG
jgi:hypothetical protein